MKKFVSALMSALLLATTLAGCSGGGASSSASSAASGASSAASSSGSAQSSSAASSQSASKSEAAALEGGDVYVFIAASLKNAMTELQTIYKEKQPNVNLIFNADSSGTLQTQIEEGAACDIFFSAAQKQMTALTEKGKVKAENVTNLLENKVVLIKAKGAKTSVTGFDNITSAASLALAGEDVPVGQYSREIFTNLGILDNVMKMEINEGANVTAVLTAVSEGSNEVGVVYATDAASMKDTVEIIAEAKSDTLKSPVIYPVGLVDNPEAKEAQLAAAKDFLAFLQTDEAMEVFKKYGFSANAAK